MHAERKKQDNPGGVQPITWDEMEHLGVDDEGHLYWDGVPVKTEERISLSALQKVGAIVTVVSTFTLAVVAVINLILRFMG